MSSVAQERPGTGRLQRDAVGVRGLVFMVIAVTAPLTAVASNLSLSLALGVGTGTIGMIILTTFFFVLFSAGYVALSRKVVNTGAYYAYIGFGLGRRSGAAAAMMAIVGYNFAVATFAVLTGYFGSAGLDAHLGISIHWWVIALVVVAAVWLIGYLGISIAAGVSAWIAVSEFLLLGALSLAILFRRPEGFSLDVFNPASTFDGNVGLAFIFVLTSFAGYEAAAIYGEEVRGGRDSIGTATYAALGLLAVTFLIITWVMIAAVSDVVATAQEDPGALLTTISSEYLGDWTGPVLTLMIAFSFFAAAMSFHAMSARYLFSSGREGYLPSVLTRVHPNRHTPVLAGTVQIAITLLIILPFVIADADPLVEFLPAIAGHNALVVLMLLLGCCVSAVVASARGKLGASIWAGYVAPSVAACAFVVVIYLVVTNYSTVTGSSSMFINLMPLLIVVAIAYGAVMGGRHRGLDLEADPAQVSVDTTTSDA